MSKKHVSQNKKIANAKFRSLQIIYTTLFDIFKLYMELYYKFEVKTVNANNIDHTEKLSHSEINTKGA